MVNSDDIKLLESMGWEVQSREPFIIRHAETHSFATRDAAEIILESYKRRKNELPEHIGTEERTAEANWLEFRKGPFYLGRVAVPKREP